LYNLVYHPGMPNIINITDFRNNIGTYIDKIIYQHEIYLLKKGRSIVAKVAAYSEESDAPDNLPTILGEMSGLWADVDRSQIHSVFAAIDKEDGKKAFAIPV
jgi:hypothetical protein